jgi:hypothetical protein
MSEIEAFSASTETETDIQFQLAVNLYMLKKLAVNLVEMQQTNQQTFTGMEQM